MVTDGGVVTVPTRLQAQLSQQQPAGQHHQPCFKQCQNHGVSPTASSCVPELTGSSAGRMEIGTTARLVVVVVVVMVVVL